MADKKKKNSSTNTKQKCQERLAEEELLRVKRIASLRVWKKKPETESFSRVFKKTIEETVKYNSRMDVKAEQIKVMNKMNLPAGRATSAPPARGVKIAGRLHVKKGVFPETSQRLLMNTVKQVVSHNRHMDDKEEEIKARNKTKVIPNKNVN